MLAVLPSEDSIASSLGRLEMQYRISLAYVFPFHGTAHSSLWPHCRVVSYLGWVLCLLSALRCTSTGMQVTRLEFNSYRATQCPRIDE